MTATYTVYSPATGAPVGEAPVATRDDLERAVAVAKAAFPGWASRTAYDREATLRKAAAHARFRADAIGRLMALEQGKPLAQCISEVNGACDTLEYFAAEAPRLEGYANPTETAHLYSWVRYVPVGVCALLTPWNYPVSLLSWKLGPALATGCTCVVKPTPTTPLSPRAFCDALTEGGLPAGVVNVVTGPEEALGAALVVHPEVAKVAMTGSTATGKKILAACATQLKKVSLELGGNCPAVVCADADLDLAARVLCYKGFRNMGQSCSGINRVYAHASILEDLVEKVAAIARAMTIGDGISDPKVDLGPMTTAAARARVEAHVGDALARGAKLVTGGARPDGERFACGHFYLPTVLTGMTSEMRLAKEETFGPVLPFAAFDSLDEAIGRANDTPFGLVAYAFTRDLATTARLSDTLAAGTVCINHGAVNTNYGPYEGWGDSGYGVELGRRSLFEYLKTKHVKVQLPAPR